MLTDQLSQLMHKAFEAARYDSNYGQIVSSNRPDLCQFQCNGAMSAAKAYKKAPFIIAEEVIAKINSYEESTSIIASIEMVKPGFINISLTDDYLSTYINQCATDDRIGVPLTKAPQTIVMDYGGPNIAKPLHVGHLRTAIIGEAIKRTLKFLGHKVIADIHTGDFGTQMGMIISEYLLTDPDLPYFDDNFIGTYPEAAPFTLDDLEELYPRVSAQCKEDEERLELAKAYTKKLQNGDKGCVALWHHIVHISLEDIKKNYQRLNVDFDLWYGESNAYAYIDAVTDLLESKNAVYESDGAQVVDVTHPDDKKDLPPMILFKSDGSALYSTTDLATIYQREQDFHPDTILYVVDNRQATHFTQVFRCAQDNEVVRKEISLEHIGFGTMNGKDGKPFKTRTGGTIKLSELIDMVEESAANKIRDKEDIDPEAIAQIVGLATLKYADLSNYRAKDYVFDLDKFSSFEGKTGPYILYTYVRINNIISKLESTDLKASAITNPASDTERDLFLKIAQLPGLFDLVEKDRAPNHICEYIYDLSVLINGFYHKHHILNEVDLVRKASWYSLLKLLRKVLALNLDLLGIDIPEKM